MLNKHTYRLLFSIILLFSVVSIYPYRTIKFKHLTKNVALKQSSVNCFYQDSVGYVYFGTNEGLFRYDGNSSNIYWNNINRSKLSENNYIISICEISSKELLISSRGGFFIFNKTLQLFSPININYSLNKNKTHFVKKDNRIYVLSDSGVGRLNIGSKNNKHIIKYIDLNDRFNGISESVITHSITKDGNIIILNNNNTLLRFDTKKESLTKLHSFNQNIVYAYEDSNNYLWIGGGGKTIYRAKSDSNKIDTFSLNWGKISYDFVKHITSICEDSNNNIIIGSNSNGICIINRDEKYKKRPKIEYYKTDYSQSNSLCDNNISTLFSERSGALFAGTKGNGVNIINTGQHCFTQHIIDINDGNSLDHIRVNAITEDKFGNIWFGTRLGLNRYNRKTNKYYCYHNKLANKNVITPKGVAAIGEITCFCHDTLGNLWMGSYGMGLYKYQYSEDKFYQFKDKNGQFIPSDRITDITTDSKGNIWVGTHGSGFSKIEGINKDSILLKYYHCNTNSSPLGFKRHDIDVIFEDQEKHLWIARRNMGLYRFDPETNKTIRHNYAANKENTISNNFTISMCSDKKGNVWFGTARGLNRFNIQTKQFTNFTMESGLPHNSICGVVSDKNNNIWLYTQRGIYHFTPSTKEFKNYIENNRIFHEAFTIDPTYKNSSGKIFLGTMNNGCIEFYPDSIIQNSSEPDIIISDIKVSGSSLKNNSIINKQQKSVYNLDFIELQYNENDISIAVTYFDYQNNQQGFKYRLKGNNNKWKNSLNNTANAHYTNLQPGNYRFEVLPLNIKQTNSKYSYIDIKINPPIWETVYAYLLYLIVLVVAIWLSYRYTKTRIKLKNELNIERMKLSFFTNISHEFRTPLTLISGPLQRLSSKEETMSEFEAQSSYSTINRNVEKLKKLVNQILDIRKIDNQKMSLNKEECNIHDFVIDIFNSFKYLAENKNISYLYHCENKDLNTFIDKDKIEKSIYNLLSNAFKYTPDNGEIKLQITSDNHQIKISVRDSGPGIPKEHINNIFNRFYRIEDSSNSDISGTGLGLSIVKSFTEMHNGKVTVFNNDKKGCSFVISLPIIKINKRISNNITENVSIEFSNNSSLIEKQTDKTPNISSNRPQILVVDDNREIREFIESCLNSDYDIILSENGKEALSEANDKNPELIISDVMMPEMDGFELCKTLKSDINTSHIPVILLTAKSSSDNKIEGIETGADSYITKPFDINYLKARVKNLIESRKKLRDAYSNSELDKPELPTTNNLDTQFLEKARSIVEKNLENPEFTVTLFISEIGISNSVLYRKLKALTGLSANEFIKDIRLKKSMQLLKTGQYTVSEVATMVGFNDAKYFGSCFKKKYGVLAKEVR